MKLPPMLVVDDEKNMRLSLETVLRAEGYQVRLAESAEAALKAVDAEEFFMVVTDGRLGGMSGYDLLRVACIIILPLLEAEGVTALASAPVLGLADVLFRWRAEAKAV